MSTVRESIEVAVPARVAFEHLAHFENYPHFMSGVMNLTPLSDTTAHMVLDIGGNRAEFDACITDSRPGEFLCWEAMDGPQLQETLQLQPISANSTRIIAELQLDSQQLMPSETHASEVLNRRLKADLDGFKRFCEDGGGTGLLPGTGGASTKSRSAMATPATVARGRASVSSSQSGGGKHHSGGIGEGSTANLTGRKHSALPSDIDQDSDDSF
jgi:ribosome-associated toxin RatA of RatAB toxin-antitoxin module